MKRHADLPLMMERRPPIGTNSLTQRIRYSDGALGGWRIPIYYVLNHEGADLIYRRLFFEGSQ